MTPIHLTTRAPSPTTTQYTVANRRPPSTALAQTTYYIQITLRCIFGLCLLVALGSLAQEVVTCFRDDELKSYRGPVHEWAQRYGMLQDKRATWIAIGFLNLCLWLLSRRRKIGMYCSSSSVPASPRISPIERSTANITKRNPCSLSVA